MRPQISTSEQVLANWQVHAARFIEKRRGLCGATPDEALVGYVDGFKPVYIAPWQQVEGESWYVWFIFPGDGKAARIVSEILPGTYVDHEGNVYEHDPELVIVLGTVTRRGNQPLLSPDMLK